MSTLTRTCARTHTRAHTTMPSADAAGGLSVHDPLSVVALSTAVLSFAAFWVLIHHRTTVRLVYIATHKSAATLVSPRAAATPAATQQQQQRRCCGAAWSGDAAVYVALAFVQLITVLALLTMHLAVLLVASMIVFTPSAGAAGAVAQPEVRTAVVTAFAVAAALSALDVALNLSDWDHAIANCMDGFLGVPRATRERRAQLRAEQAAERTTPTPMTWLAMLALHVAYAATVPLHLRAPPSGLTAPDPGAVDAQQSHSDLVANAATVTLLSVWIGTLVGLALVRHLLVGATDRALRTSAAARAIADGLLRDVHENARARTLVDATVRGAALVDAFVTALVLLATWNSAEAVRTDNWRLLYVGLVVCVPVATVVVSAVYCACGCCACSALVPGPDARATTDDPGTQ